MSFTVDRRVACGIACSMIGVAAAVLWRLKRTASSLHCLRIVAPGDEVAHYSDLIRRVVLDLDVVSVTTIDSSSVRFYWCGVDGELELLARIPLPDHRVYRSLPVAVFRLIQCKRLLPLTQDEERAVLHSTHEAAFSCVLQMPKSICPYRTSEPAVPSQVWMTSNSRCRAECFLFDVVHAHQDPMISNVRVVDVVCRRGLVHHGGNWRHFVDDIGTRFALDVREIETYEELCERLLQNRNTFASAVLTPAGANKLEMVFGVAAVHFFLLQCSADSVVFVQELYAAAVAAFGKWTYDNFVAYIHAVFSHDRPEVVRHVPRIFRALNKSRTGEISFDELCSWIAKKLSLRSSKQPEQHLVATVMSLRLPYAFFVDKRHLWPKMQCTLRSLSDEDCHV